MFSLACVFCGIIAACAVYSTASRRIPAGVALLLLSRLARRVTPFPLSRPFFAGLPPRSDAICSSVRLSNVTSPSLPFGPCGPVARSSPAALAARLHPATLRPLRAGRSHFTLRPLAGRSRPLFTPAGSCGPGSPFRLGPCAPTNSPLSSFCIVVCNLLRTARSGNGLSGSRVRCACRRLASVKLRQQLGKRRNHLFPRR